MRFSAVAATAAVLGTPCACAFSLSPAQRQGRTASALFASDDSGDSGPAFLRSLDLE
eukprot:CAMPEP_0113553640 /NCGR_PEP_ID=MMETSP0015_2-20120614/15723_1 /TAXON_ID=2838 /ORGANISM="Odontella" /LENGTH=56 /DNA_ID=CAMNT_0000454727 /DNA_START=180 /DNA_END=347 /DNA_ORIENTATION=+ /assembly_acc=CAM_ASM_000160